MSIEFLFPALAFLACLAIFAYAIVYKPRTRDIDYVILFARKLDVSELEALLDAASEWKLRSSLTKWALQRAQEDRIRLAGEYVRRVAHNASLIQLWVLQEYHHLEGKKPEHYNERDLLIVEALQLAVDLRVSSMAVQLRILFWMALSAYRWPTRFLPCITDLRVQCGVNVVEKYRRLTA